MTHFAALKISPDRNLKRRVVWWDNHTPPPTTTANNAIDRSPPDLESTPDSESAKGHPELLMNRRHLLLPSPLQKYRAIRLKHILPIFLVLAAGFPFIVHLKLAAMTRRQNQNELKVDESQWSQNNSISQRKGPHKIRGQLLDTRDIHEVEPRKIGPRLRYTSRKNSLMAFHSFPERGSSSLPPWIFLTPNPQITIKLDWMTVSLLSGIAGNAVVRSSSVVQESTKNRKESIAEDENVVNTSEDAESQDKMFSLTSETAAWDPEQECVPMADWQTTFNPTCNSVHEMDMPFLLNKEAYYLVSNKGFWRNAWRVDMNIAEDGMSPVSDIVIKSLKYIHSPNDETFELNRVDGVSMEQLTQSTYITDIYGYCGTTSLQEFAGAGVLAKFLPKLKPIEKLGMAAWVAAGVADIHEVGGDDTSVTSKNNITASLIHNDINMDNLLLGYRDGIRVPLINDFNIAIFRKKDSLTGAPCRFRGRFTNPQWMAPEQMFTEDRDDGGLSTGFLNEKIDVYALGNILYKIAVGNSPWKFNFNKAPKILEEHKEKITKMKLEGRKPKIPDEVRNSDDPSIRAVLTAMDRCYRNDPDIRPSAREVSDYLNAKFLSLARTK